MRSIWDAWDSLRPTTYSCAMLVTTWIIWQGDGALKGVTFSSLWNTTLFSLWAFEPIATIRWATLACIRVLRWDCGTRPCMVRYWLKSNDSSASLWCDQKLVREVEGLGCRTLLNAEPCISVHKLCLLAASCPATYRAGSAHCVPLCQCWYPCPLV